MKILVIGGGAAGFFSAINIAEKHSKYEITIIEKSSKILQKVKVSGGGRCNVTNERSKPSELIPFYPRGSKKLHPVFKEFTTTDMTDWLEHRGVQLKAEEDHRMFPITDSSKTVIDCFLNEAKKHRVKVIQNESLAELKQDGSKWIAKTKSNQYIVDKIVFTTGSSISAIGILEQLGLEITDLVPSLFTFNIGDERLKDLSGISFDKTTAKIAGSKLEESGPLLITHWGLSGPSILKLSSRGAYELAAKNYEFEVLINFIGGLKPDEIRNHIREYSASNPKRKVINYPLFELPKRFWERIVSVCGVGVETPFMELSKKHINKLVEELGQGRYTVNGKSTFKEEFVTAGGVKLSEVNLKTFECKRFPGLYLAGEILDIDALTGGFNFQACWSAGWLISENI